MKSSRFKAFLADITELTWGQSERLVRHLEAQKTSRESTHAFSRHQPKSCPHCGHKKLGRNGVQNGLQRYRCSACSRTSTAVTGSPLARLKDKAKLAAYATCMGDGLTLQKTADRIGISLHQSFHWRHAFLARQVDHQPAPVAGILEIDETYFPRSRKGERKLIRPPHTRGGSQGKGRGRRSCEWVPVLIGRVRGQPLVVDRVLNNMKQATVAQALAASVDPQKTLLTTDGSPSLCGVGALLKVATCSFLASQQAPGNPVHVQSVNAYHQRLKSWLNHTFRGVSTKYLPHYLAWQRLRHWSRKPLPAAVYIGSALGHQLINLKAP